MKNEPPTPEVPGGRDAGPRHSGEEPVPVSNPRDHLPRTARAFGSLEKALRVRREILERYPMWASNALRLFDADRGRVFRFWDRLEPPGRARLLEQVSRMDLDLLERNLALLGNPEAFRARTEGPLAPPEILRSDEDPGAADAWALGEEVLAEGWLALVEGAGGAGSRFAEAAGSLPKGLYPISPSRSRNFFEERLSRIVALRRRYRKPIPYIVMVSEATEEATRRFFEQQGYFGLEDEILIVPQRSLPYVEEVAPGEYDLVLEAPDRVAVGGYGHGDFTKCILLDSRVLAFLEKFGTRYVQWLQIDNPLATIGHRYLLGAHRRAEPTLNPDAIAMSFIALPKETPTERAGVLVRRKGGLAVWEYSDMDEVSQYLLADREGNSWLAVERDGRVALISPAEHRSSDRLLALADLPARLTPGLQYRWGAINPNIVVVTLATVVAHPEDLPPLVARKTTRHIDADGRPGDPTKKFLKFESFLFDGFNDGVVVAEAREHCFAPAKNARGEASPEQVRPAMTRQAAGRLLRLGWQIPDRTRVTIELGGLLELDDASLAARVGRNGRIDPGGTLVIHGLDLALGDGLVIEAGGELVIEVPDEDPRAGLDISPRLQLPPGLKIARPVRYPEA